MCFSVGWTLMSIGFVHSFKHSVLGLFLYWNLSTAIPVYKQAKSMNVDEYILNGPKPSEL